MDTFFFYVELKHRAFNYKYCTCLYVYFEHAIGSLLTELLYFFGLGKGEKGKNENTNTTRKENWISCTGLVLLVFFISMFLHFKAFLSICVFSFPRSDSVLIQSSKNKKKQNKKQFFFLNPSVFILTWCWRECVLHDMFSLYDQNM